MIIVNIMTLENINNRGRQSSLISQYMLQNPSNNIQDIDVCYSQPGLVCKSLHVKHGESVDNETLLLRGVHSTVVERPVNKLAPPANILRKKEGMLTRSFLGEPTRLSKACYSELDLTPRIDIHQPVSFDTLPLIDNTDMFGENSRNTAKYGGK
jgi:hypothetical protein